MLIGKCLINMVCVVLPLILEIAFALTVTILTRVTITS